MSRHCRFWTWLMNLCTCRWLYVTEDDIKSLPCFQVFFFSLILVTVKMINNSTLLGIYMYQVAKSSLQHAEPNSNCYKSTAWYDFGSPRSWWGGLQNYLCHTQGHRQMLHFVKGVNFPTQVNDYPQRRYRIVLRSTMGPIDVYLVRYAHYILMSAIC